MNIRILLTAFIFQAFTAGVIAQNKVMVASHRGDWRNAPENSLLAFEYAAAMGVDVIELDLAKVFLNSGLC
jgi:glycerophosphoryl diester phosphodiesterase